jgi:hypothetical protein
MASEKRSDSYFCDSCHEFHSGLPISYAADSPDSYAWLKDSERKDRVVLGSDQCIIDEDKYFIRGVIELPVIGREDVFLWGVWASVWEKDFDEINAHWETPGREGLIGPYKGRLNNRLSEYPDTFNLKCIIRIQAVGSRPLFYIDEPEHPLAQEQIAGISVERIQAIAAHLAHKRE